MSLPIIIPSKHIYGTPKFNINNNKINNVKISENQIIPNIRSQQFIENYIINTSVYEDIMGNYITDNEMMAKAGKLNANLAVQITYGIYSYTDNIETKLDKIDDNLFGNINANLKINFYNITNDNTQPFTNTNINVNTNEIKIYKDIKEFKNNIYETTNSINILGLYGLFLVINEQQDINNPSQALNMLKIELESLKLLNIGIMIDNSKLVVLLAHLKEIKIDTYVYSKQPTGANIPDYQYKGFKKAINIDYDYLNNPADGRIWDIGVINYKQTDNVEYYDYEDNNPFITNRNSVNNIIEPNMYLSTISERISRQYGNGKITGSMQVGYGDYYYVKTKYGEIVLNEDGSFENGDLYGYNLNKPKQLLKVGDIVIPMKYENGIDVPMYKTFDGKIKLFEITSAELKTKGVAKLYLEMVEHYNYMRSNYGRS